MVLLYDDTLQQIMKYSSAQNSSPIVHDVLIMYINIKPQLHTTISRSENLYENTSQRSFFQMKYYIQRTKISLPLIIQYKTTQKLLSQKYESLLFTPFVVTTFSGS
jgi:hypothetical protein